MAITLAPVVIRSFDIAESVGNGGRNKPDDMFSVKSLLNGILLIDGGAEGALDPNDSSDSGPEFERMAFAIARFQAVQFPGEFEPDGLVEPNRKTIKGLHRIFDLHRVPLPVFIGISPLLPTSGDTDMLGFSAARLTQTRPRADWTGRDLSLPATQMVPVLGTRTLVVTFATAIMPTFRIEDESIAMVKSVILNMVTVEGRNPGKTTLFCFIGAFEAVRVQLIVRRARTKNVDVIHLGAPQNANAPQQFLDNVLPDINEVFEPQTNIRFAPGVARSVTAATLDGAPFSIGPGPLFVLEEGEAPPPGGQGVRFRDLQFLVQNNDAITVFISPNLHALDQTTGGQGEHPGNKCWFRTGMNLALDTLTLPAHEIGHTLGLAHVTSAPTVDYLMRPADILLLKQQRKIPSGTLDDLTLN